MTANILILGGGYSGVMAALRLAGRTRRVARAITLVNADFHFVERPRLHEAATGVPLRRRKLARMLAGTGVRFVRGRALTIEPEAARVAVATAAGDVAFDYDYLIHALGSRVDRSAVPGVREHTFTLDPDGALSTAALRARLEEAAGQRAHHAASDSGADRGAVPEWALVQAGDSPDSTFGKDDVDPIFGSDHFEIDDFRRGGVDSHRDGGGRQGHDPGLGFRVVTLWCESTHDRSCRPPSASSSGSVPRRKWRRFARQQ